MASEGKNRIAYLVTSFVLLLFLGLIYAWSVFIGPLEGEFGWARSQTSVTFTISMIGFCVGNLASGTITPRDLPARLDPHRRRLRRRRLRGLLVHDLAPVDIRLLRRVLRLRRRARRQLRAVHRPQVVPRPPGPGLRRAAHGLRPGQPGLQHPGDHAALVAGVAHHLPRAGRPSSAPCSCWRRSSSGTPPRSGSAAMVAKARQGGKVAQHDFTTPPRCSGAPRSGCSCSGSSS